MSEAGGEHQTVVGQGRERDPMVGDRSTERRDDGRSGDGSVGGDRQGVAGVIIEPGQDLDVGSIREAVVGEVSLPGLVGLLGLEPDV